MAGDVRWTQVVVDVSPSWVEGVSDDLWEFDTAAIEEVALGGSVRLVAGYVDEASARRAAAHLVSYWDLVPDVRPVVDDGLDGWRAWARPEAAGPFTITPAWLAHEVAPGDGRLLVEPGRTFGSGSHPTTRLVLARAARLVRPGDRVLDVGCGSGILAVGAALLGAGSVEGIDIDGDSPAVTLANARANGVADRVAASTEPLDEVATRPGDEGRYDLVLANLLAPVVADLAPHLAAVLRPVGHLVVSGLLADRWEPTVRAVRDAADPATRLAVESVDEEEGWVAVTLAARPLDAPVVRHPRPAS